MIGGNSNGKLGMVEGAHHDQPKQIYLSKPGGQREGPFTVDQINRDLASKKYKDTDYWAWYEGLSEWVPLHGVPGVFGPGRPAPVPPLETKKPVQASPQKAPAPVARSNQSIANPQPEEAEELFKRATTAKPTASRAAAPAVSEDEVIFSKAPQPASPSKASSKPSESAAAAAKVEIASGLPFVALEQIFIFTSGEARGVMQLPVVAGMLQDVVGQDLATIRSNVSRDIIGNCDFGERLRRDGAIPEAAWRAMSLLRPEVVQLAREGTYSACIRTFTTGAKEVVAVFLFYNKNKM